uniref:Uncharacterized protein n=1 Tax=Alexandrium andersonii TaxID=327968 RepID=A0A7S2G1Y3_9DINO|mmetsp:Transcript_3998/g.9030  ORF Transcript_3998/g.9030 Transcript_3998/m.9030 type:complete len:125 (+) Transcript_3998:103-477(+)
MSTSQSAPSDAATSVPRSESSKDLESGRGSVGTIEERLRTISERTPLRPIKRSQRMKGKEERTCILGQILQVMTVVLIVASFLYVLHWKFYAASTPEALSIADGKSPAANFVVGVPAAPHLPAR